MPSFPGCWEDEFFHLGMLQGDIYQYKCPPWKLSEMLMFLWEDLELSNQLTNVSLLLVGWDWEDVLISLKKKGQDLSTRSPGVVCSQFFCGV